MHQIINSIYSLLNTTACKALLWCLPSDLQLSKSHIRFYLPQGNTLLLNDCNCFIKMVFTAVLLNILHETEKRLQQTHSDMLQHNNTPVRNRTRLASVRTLLIKRFCFRNILIPVAEWELKEPVWKALAEGIQGLMGKFTTSNPQGVTDPDTKTLLLIALVYPRSACKE